MKKNRIFSVLAAMALCSTVAAQNLNSAYFLDGYTYGHQLNPAKDYDRKGYVAFPMFGNINLGMNGNISLTDVLKFNGNQLTTFLNPNIPIDQALSGFSSENQFSYNQRVDLLGFGFHAWGGFNTFNVSLRNSANFNAPYGMFEALKELDNKSYDLSGTSLESLVWSEIGLGHSRQINDAIRVGAKVKFLLAGLRAKLDVNQATLDLTGPDRWQLTADAKAEVSIKGYEWGALETREYSDGTTYKQIDFDNIDVESPGLNGWGLGFDLGAEWDLGEQGWVDGLTMSASLLDLGFLSWNETYTAYNKGKTVNINGFNDVQVDGGPGTPMGDQTDKYGDRFSDLIALQKGEVTKSTTSLAATFNYGLEYEMPFYNRLSVGVLFTTRIQGKYTWNEDRISATISPLDWLEASVNVGLGTYGTSFGWVANIHPRGFNLFLGMDYCSTKLSKQYVPLGKNTGFTMGINFPFGKAK